MILVAMMQIAPTGMRAETPAADPAAATPIKTLVMPFTARRGTPPALAKTLTEAAITTLGSSKGRNILGQNDIRAVVDTEAERQALGCDSSGCLEEIAAAMDVDSLITGSIDQLRDGYVVIITELDAREVKQVARVQGSSTLDEEDLFRLVTELAEELLAKTSGKIQLFGQIEIQTIPSGIPVFVGNRDLGLSPVRKDVPIGIHHVRIEYGIDKGIPATFSIEVKRQRTSKATVSLSIPQEVPLEKLESYRSNWNSLAFAAGTKGCGSCSTLFLGGLGGTVGLMCSPSLARGPSNVQNLGTETATVAGLQLMSVASFSACSVLLPCGFALLGWTAWDLISFPEEPLPGVPQHHILITPPDGEPITLTLPAREETMAH